jgi:hypothetical protein
LSETLLLDRTNESGFGALVHGAVRDLQLELQLHSAFIEPLALRQHLLHHVALNVGEPEIAAHVVEGEARVIQAETVQQGRL